MRKVKTASKKAKNVGTKEQKQAINNKFYNSQGEEEEEEEEEKEEEGRKEKQIKADVNEEQEALPFNEQESMGSFYLVPNEALDLIFQHSDYDSLKELLAASKAMRHHGQGLVHANISRDINTINTKSDNDLKEVLVVSKAIKPGVGNLVHPNISISINATNNRSFVSVEKIPDFKNEIIKFSANIEKFYAAQQALFDKIAPLASTEIISKQICYLKEKMQQLVKTETFWKRITPVGLKDLNKTQREQGEQCVTRIYFLLQKYEKLQKLKSIWETFQKSPEASEEQQKEIAKIKQSIINIVSGTQNSEVNTKKPSAPSFWSSIKQQGLRLISSREAFVQDIKALQPKNEQVPQVLIYLHDLHTKINKYKRDCRNEGVSAQLDTHLQQISALILTLNTINNKFEEDFHKKLADTDLDSLLKLEKQSLPLEKSVRLFKESEAYTRMLTQTIHYKPKDKDRELMKNYKLLRARLKTKVASLIEGKKNVGDEIDMLLDAIISMEKEILGYCDQQRRVDNYDKSYQLSLALYNELPNNELPNHKRIKNEASQRLIDTCKTIALSLDGMLRHLDKKIDDSNCTIIEKDGFKFKRLHLEKQYQQFTELQERYTQQLQLNKTGGPSKTFSFI